MTRKAQAPRRSFLAKAAASAAGVGMLAAPVIGRAQTTSLRFQSTSTRKILPRRSTT
jgi:hypothetical protein